MATNRVDKILVTNGTEQATVAALTPGDYIVTVDGKAANTPIVAGDKFQVAVKRQSGEVKYSDPIKADDIKAITKLDYSPVVEQSYTVTVGTPVDGEEYALVIVNKSDKEILQKRQDKRTYLVTADSASTATTVADDFAAQINNDEASDVVATAAAGVITITAKAKEVTPNIVGQYGLQHYFSVALRTESNQGHYKSFGTVVEATSPSFGNGTIPHVRTLEQWSAGYDGILNRRLFPVQAVEYDSIIGKTYDMYVIEYDNNYWSNSVVYGKVDSPISLVLAVEAGEGTDLETILANFM